MTARGRGRPRALNADQQAVLVGALSEGLLLGDAARIVGTHRDTVHATRRYEPAFDRAVVQALADGRAARRSRWPHGTESRYVHIGCRCPPCTGAATTARLGRREAADPTITDRTASPEDVPCLVTSAPCPPKKSPPPPLMSAKALSAA